MPIGISGSLAVCTVLYILFALVLTGMVPYKKLGVAAPVTVAMDRRTLRTRGAARRHHSEGLR